MNIRAQKVFFLSLFLGAFGLLAYIFSPFFAVILLGVVAGIALEPLFVWARNTLKLGPSLASLFTVSVVIVAIIATMSLIGTQLAIQAQSIGQNVVLGTDGFGRSESREALRDFFEVDARHIVYATLGSLCKRNRIKADVVQKAAADLKINPNKLNPMIS